MLLSASISVLWGFAVGGSVHGGTLDFQGVYYGTRCLLQGCDPYNEAALERVYKIEGGESPAESIQHVRTVTLYVNLPTAFPFIAPFALLPWGAAQIFWAGSVVACIFVGTFLMWDVAATNAPVGALLLGCILLANSEVLFATANTAGIVVGLAAIAVWCFMKDRLVMIGILCLAVSLSIKPHDVGFVWLYFLLAGGVNRRRALQTLAMTCVIGIAAVFWLSHIAPHWIPEMRANLAEITGRGGLNAPGPASLTGHTAAMVIDLQAAVSVLKDEPSFYNAISYTVCGILLIVWSVSTLRSPSSSRRAWFGLATVSALTLLVTYHRPYDAKILMLTIPGCAILWSDGGLLRWVAFGLTSAGILFTGDIPLVAIVEISKRLNLGPWGLPGKFVEVALTRPASVILLAITVFYLWIYVKQARNELLTTRSSNESGTQFTPRLS